MLEWATFTAACMGALGSCYRCWQNERLYRFHRERAKKKKRA
jgi:hypothetical protein